MLDPNTRVVNYASEINHGEVYPTGRPEYHGVAIAIALISLVFDGVSGTHLRGDVSKIVAAMDDSLADG